MGGKPKERLLWKEPLHSLGVELEQEYGLSPVQGKPWSDVSGRFWTAT